jgi:hypothetical protein
MILKIQNGTRTGGRRLCETCAEAVVMRGVSAKEEVVFCEQTRRSVPIDVMECNRYKEGGKPSLWDMRQVAWILDVDSRRQRIGFQTATEWRRRHDDEEVVPDFLLD